MNAIVSNVATDCDLPLVPDKNFTRGVKEFISAFRNITTLEEDILTISSAIFAADLAFKRKPNEEFIRTIELTIDVVNMQAIESVKKELEYALWVLSCDNWTLKFRPKTGIPESTRQWSSKKGSVLLFSGGLDSLSAAILYLEQKETLCLVSHVTHNKTVENCQKSLHQELQSSYLQKIPRNSFRIGGRTSGLLVFPKDNDREDTQRTRSFLFLSLAVLVARRLGFQRIVNIAENGQFAVHLPLTAARVGPFSTHTAHPEFVHITENLYKTLLGLDDLEIINPFLYKTKSEVLQIMRPDVRKKFIPLTVSCWRTARLREKLHCGVCIPCLARRVSYEALGYKFKEFQRDLLNEDIESLPPDDIGKKNLVDLSEFIYQFLKYYPTQKDTLLETFPEIINEYLDQREVMRMYHRFSRETAEVFKKYPKLSFLLR